VDAPLASSDRNAWLLPYWADLHRQSSFFANLAPELQASALADHIAVDYPDKAAEIRGWTPVTRRAVLAVLDRALRQKHADDLTELWRMRRAAREVRCVAVRVGPGIDLRLLEDGEMRRTELVWDAPQHRFRCARCTMTRTATLAEAETSGWAASDCVTSSFDTSDQWLCPICVRALRGDDR
jgi:hypothetical protein